MKYCCVLVYNSLVKLIGFIWHTFCLISVEDSLITTGFSDFDKGDITHRIFYPSVINNENKYINLYLAISIRITK